MFSPYDIENTPLSGNGASLLRSIKIHNVSNRLNEAPYVACVVRHWLQVLSAGYTGCDRQSSQITEIRYNKHKIKETGRL